MLAFDKPSGLAVVAERGVEPGTALMEVARQKWGSTIANVHRLEADASGLVLCAKTKPVLDFLSGQFQSKTVDKRFLAVCALQSSPQETAVPGLELERGVDGSLPEVFTLDLPVDVDTAKPGRMRVVKKRPTSKACVTEVKILERFGRFLLVECRPLTARTHQLRVHLAAVGAPILNDTMYGDAETKLLLSDLKRGYKGREDEKPLIDRLALHASALTVMHAVSREPVTMRAPLPHEFEVALKYLRKFAGHPSSRRR